MTPSVPSLLNEWFGTYVIVPRTSLLFWRWGQSDPSVGGGNTVCAFYALLKGLKYCEISCNIFDFLYRCIEYL